MEDFVESLSIGHSEGVQTEGDNVPVFPISRIKRIVKLDKEFRQVSTDVAVVIMCATQLFLEHMSEATLSAALQKKHKSIRLEDVRSAVKIDRRVVDFLGDALDELFDNGKEAESASDYEDNDQVNRVQAEADNENCSRKKTKVGKNSIPTPLPGSRRIIDFFGSKTEVKENLEIGAESP
eukprot:c22289_g1_i1 orf=700-1239(-)